MSQTLLTSAYEMLEWQLGQFREAISGIPDEDLNVWKPAAEANGGGEMNTFGVLAAHITGAGTWRVFQHIYGDDVHRDRDSEFRATVTAEEIDQMFDDWLEGFRERLEREEQPDLDSLPDMPPDVHPDWSRRRWVLSLMDHTALHIGHAQIHRQLWLTERGSNPQ